MSRVDASTRVRRAIHLQDLTLLKRIVKNSPKDLQNPDFADNGNTSLHLAAKLGLLDIAEFLIDAGHEQGGISKNANLDTPLHLAVESSEEVAELLASRFPRCVAWKNKQGADAVCFPSQGVEFLQTQLTTSQLMLTSRSPHTPLIPLLLTFSPPTTPQAIYTPLSSTDNSGNTPLHYASAYGQLKSIRTLLEHGADASARNAWSWTPVSYSASVQAEVYFKGLVNAAEREREGMREAVAGAAGQRARSRSRGGSGGRGGVRLVEEEREEEWMWLRAASGGSGGSFGRVRAGSGE